MKKAVLATVMSFAVACLWMSQVQADDQVVGPNKKVKFDYTLTVDGKEAETSKGKQPIEYVQGSGQIIPGLENQLVGMKAGDNKKITLEAKDAYGEVIKEGFKDVPKSTFPADFKFLSSTLGS